MADMMPIEMQQEIINAFVKGKRIFDTPEASDAAWEAYKEFIKTASEQWPASLAALAEAQSKVAVAERWGMKFGMMKEAGKAPYMTSDIREGSGLAKLQAELPARIDAEAEVERLKNACAKLDGEVCQILGQALEYPWYKDDQKNFPGSTEADGVCVGEHVAQSLAAEMVQKYKLTRLLASEGSKSVLIGELNRRLELFEAALRELLERIEMDLNPHEAIQVAKKLLEGKVGDGNAGAGGVPAGDIA